MTFLVQQRRLFVFLIMLGLVVPLCGLQCIQALAVPHVVISAAELPSSLFQVDSQHAGVKSSSDCIEEDHDDHCLAPVISGYNGTAQAFSIDKYAPILHHLGAYTFEETIYLVTLPNEPIKPGYPPPYRLHLLNSVFLD